MFELKIFKNVSRKRTSTNVIKKDEESRRKICKTIKKEIVTVVPMTTQDINRGWAILLITKQQSENNLVQ